MPRAGRSHTSKGLCGPEAVSILRGPFEVSCTSSLFVRAGLLRVDRPSGVVKQLSGTRNRDEGVCAVPTHVLGCQHGCTALSRRPKQGVPVSRDSRRNMTLPEMQSRLRLRHNRGALPGMMVQDAPAFAELRRRQGCPRPVLVWRNSVNFQCWNKNFQLPSKINGVAGRWHRKHRDTRSAHHRHRTDQGMR